MGQDLRGTVTWSFEDPEHCLTLGEGDYEIIYVTAKDIWERDLVIEARSNPVQVKTVGTNLHFLLVLSARQWHFFNIVTIICSRSLNYIEILSCLPAFAI